MKYILSILFSCCLLYAGAQKNQSDAAMQTFVNALMQKMTIEEKIGQLNLLTPGGGVATGAVVSKGVEEKIAKGQVGGLFGVIGVEKIKQAQTLALSSSRLKIPLLFGSDIIHGYKTTFPIPLAISCTWDMGLVEKSARAAASEATADGLTWAFSPMVDIARDPRWGRIAEGAGEDPFLGAEIAKAMVKGYQGDDLSLPNTLLACVKHFALYGASEGGRDYNTVDMSRVRMYNEFLPPYKAAVDAKVGSVMSSFNVIDGIPATGNKWLLTDLLRKEWGFKGMVVSDYTSVNEMTEHGMGDLKEVSALALKAGLDMDMVGEGFLTTLKKSMEDKTIGIEDINKACRRILETKYRLGLFQDPFRYCNSERAKNEVLSSENRLLAKEIATKSFVLLKNNAQLLPLKKSGTLALIGPLANNKSNMLGTWAVSGNSSTAIPVLDGIKNLVGESVNVLYAKGANISDDSIFAKKINVFGNRIDIDKTSPQMLIDQAISVASKSDVVVAVIGEASEMSGESSSRTDLSIPESQIKLIQALKKTGKPLVLVIMSGRPLTLVQENQLADAILFTWHAGHEAGNAIADVLFGVYNPSGKLTTSFPRNVGQIPVHYNHLNTGRPNNGDLFQKFKSNFLDVENSPLFPFGYGLSYTRFDYKDIRLNKITINTNESVIASVMVSNTGNYDGEEVVQLYIRDMVASISRPVKELKKFQKIFLKKGETKEIQFKLDSNDFKFYNSELKWVIEPGKFNIFIGTNSNDVQEINLTVK
jgi:beta-glucosidase